MRSSIKLEEFCYLVRDGNAGRNPRAEALGETRIGAKEIDQLRQNEQREIISMSQ